MVTRLIRSMMYLGFPLSVAQSFGSLVMPLLESILTWYLSIIQSSAERAAQSVLVGLLRDAAQGHVGVADYRRPVWIAGCAGVGHLFHTAGARGRPGSSRGCDFPAAGRDPPFRS